MTMSTCAFVHSTFPLRATRALPSRCSTRFPSHCPSRLPSRYPTLYPQSRTRRHVATMSAASDPPGAATVGERHMLHAVYRVGDLAATGRFLECLGMKKLRERDMPSGKYINVFYGYGPENRGKYFSLELTYNYGVDSYDVGTGFGNFGVAVPSAADAVKRLRQAGFTITGELGPISGSTAVMAFATDPEGYTFSIAEGQRRDPMSFVMLRVTDMEKSVTFYKTMGMTLFRTIENTAERHTMCVLGFGEETDSTALELRYDWDGGSFTSGDGYAQIAVSVTDVYAAAKQFEDADIPIARAPGPVAGLGTTICAVRDPDNWKTVLVHADEFEIELANAP